MPRAVAGTEGKAIPPHIPIGGMFVPPLPSNECEMFMGSATVLFEVSIIKNTESEEFSLQRISGGLGMFNKRLILIKNAIEEIKERAMVYYKIIRLICQKDNSINRMDSHW